MKRIMQGAVSSSEAIPTEHATSSSIEKKGWISPTVITLPRLSELTLQSAGPIPGGGGTGGGGSTVVP